jgi:5'-phosphate synthase pdxT subunit
MKKVVGILALQGCLEPHEKHLRALGADVRLVKSAADLADVSGLILPGGESTTMLKLAKQFGIWDALKARAKEIPYWGVCAGSILMARAVENPAQESLDVMDVVVARNAYGRQTESFQGEVSVGDGRRAAVFIRAPKFKSWGASVSSCGRVGDEAVFLESDRHMVTAFHPELTEDSWFHVRFLEKVQRFS